MAVKIKAIIKVKGYAVVRTSDGLTITVNEVYEDNLIGGICQNDGSAVELHADDAQLI